MDDVSHRFRIVAIHLDAYLKGCLAEQFGELFESGEQVYPSASVEIGRFEYPQIIISFNFLLFNTFLVFVLIELF